MKSTCQWMTFHCLQLQVSSQDMAALIEAERVRARLSLGSGSASGFNSQHPSGTPGLNMNTNLFSVYPTRQPNVQQPPIDWTAVNNIFNGQPGSLQQQQLPVNNFQQPQNFQLWQQQAVQEQQPSTSSAFAISSDESSPPRSFISPSIVHEKPTSPSMPSSSSLPTQPPNR